MIVTLPCGSHLEWADTHANERGKKIRHPAAFFNNLLLKTRISTKSSPYTRSKKIMRDEYNIFVQIV